MSVLENWQQVQQQIEQACQKSARDVAEIKVVAVTKYVDVERMQETLQAGIEHLGESKVQDALPKWRQLHPQGIWHFIGHLQTNKVRDMIDKFTFIHSLDRLSLAKEIDKRAAQRELASPLACFV